LQQITAQGDGMKNDLLESGRYLGLAADQGDVLRQMRPGICLMSGVFGRFDFEEAQRLFDRASKCDPDSQSDQFASLLRDSLLTFDLKLMNPNKF
jgi:TPR repeat protein